MTVVEGIDLLRSPDDRCKEESGSISPTSIASSTDGRKSSSQKWDAVRRFAGKMKTPTKLPSNPLELTVRKRKQRGKPFVVVKLWDQEQRTAIGEDSHKSAFNETFEFDVVIGDEETEGFNLEITVKDSERCQSYGSTIIPLDRLSCSGKIKQWYQLARPDRSDETPPTSPSDSNYEDVLESNGRKDTCGLVLVSLHFKEEPEDIPPVVKRKSSRKLTIDTKTGRKAVRHLSNRLADYVVIAKRKKTMLVTEPPELVWRYPQVDHLDLSLPTMIEWFIFAFEGSALDRGLGEAVGNHDVELFAFVFAPRGVALYGYCLAYLDKDTSVQTCICVVSRLNCGDIFQDCLRDIFKHCMAADDPESVRLKAAKRLVNEIPMPLPGVIKVTFNIFPQSQETFTCSLDKLGSCPTMTFQQGLGFLVDMLGVQGTIIAWSAVLLEHKVLIHAEERCKLSFASETLRSLLYPFRWHHTYVSILPAQLLECVQSPLPFLIGIETRLLADIPEHDLLEVFVIDLDGGVSRQGHGINVEPLPSLELRRLTRMLHAVTDVHSSRFDDPAIDIMSLPDTRCSLLNIQLCFLECVAHLLQGYRECLFFLNDSMPVFNTPKFLRSRESGSAFVNRLLETQAFEYFKEIQKSAWLSSFHSYYFRVRMRNRDRDQFLALNSRKMNEEMFIEEEIIHEVQVERQRKALWVMREKRLSRHTSIAGLLPLQFDVDGDLLEGFNLKIGYAKELMCLQQNGKSKFELNDIASELELDSKAIKYGMRCLDVTVGTINFSVNSNHTLSELTLLENEDLDSSEEEEEEAIASPRSRMASPRSPRGASVFDFEMEQSVLQSKSARDRKVELALQECITNIFLNKEVHDDQKEACADQFMYSQHSRDLFVLILYQPHHRSSHVNGPKGRGLQQVAFSSLEYLCKALISACHKKEDYNNARQLLELSHSYYLDRSSPESGFASLTSMLEGKDSTRSRRNTINYDNRPVAIHVSDEDYLEFQLKGLPLWSMLLFWEDSFATLFEAEISKRTKSVQEPPHVFEELITSKLPPDSPKRSNTFRRSTAPPSTLKLLNMDNTCLNTRTNVEDIPAREHPLDKEKERQDTLFDLTLNMVYQMLRVGTPADKAKALVNRIVTEYGMSEEQEETLSTLINNVSKAFMGT